MVTLPLVLRSRRWLLATLAGLSVWPTVRAAPDGSTTADTDIELPGGLRLTPPGSLDLTYQVIPSYDSTEKVLAGWDGDRLLYFAAVEELPPGWQQPQTWLDGIQRQVATGAAGSVRRLGAGEYRARGDVRGHFVVVQYVPRKGDPPHIQAMHFLGDGRRSFAIIATLVQPEAATRMVDETLQLLGTASWGGTTARAPVVRNEARYAGLWLAEQALPDGRRMTVRWQLDADLRFTMQSHLDGRPVLTAAGVWSVQGNTLRTNYLHSEPTLPDYAREDEDEIESFDGRTLVLQSRRTGRRHTYRLAQR